MEKIEITTHSGIKEILEVENYNALEIADILNGVTKNEIGNPFNVITLGGNIYSCVDIKSIRAEVVENG